MTLAERLVSGLRAPATEDGYRLERAVIGNVDEALLWIENYWTPDGGDCLRREMTDPSKRRAADHWCFLRHLYRNRLVARGGRP